VRPGRKGGPGDGIGQTFGGALSGSGRQHHVTDHEAHDRLRRERPLLRADPRQVLERPLVQDSRGRGQHHLRHHVRVATPEDPASARIGERFWEFWPRTVLGSLRSAWRLETRRFRIRSRSPWTWHNHILNAWAMTAVLAACLVAAFGPRTIPFLILQGVVGFSLLEAVNYLEHYGLARQRTTAGRYEKVTARHSWNSDRVVTNIFLFQLQRHSDHHANPLRRYQALRSFEESPQLPAGYATMVVAALATPVRRRVMDPRVLAHYGGDLSLANVHPRTTERCASATRSWPRDRRACRPIRIQAELSGSVKNAREAVNCA
jgi:alkane 1-monooxygenase